MRVSKNDISDALIERPISFSANGARFSIYQPTLGKIQLISRLADAIGFRERMTEDEIYSLAIIAIKDHHNEVIRLIAYSTLPGSDCLDEDKVRGRIAKLSKINDTDLATLLVTVLSMDKTTLIMQEHGIEKESQRLSKVLKIKDKDKSSLSFGGKSIWGTVIDAACERYGWTLQYVLWGISFCNLQMLLADHVKTVFLTEEERKRNHISTDGITIDASDTAQLNKLIRTQSWK